MSTMLRTSNPTAVAEEIDPGRDYRRPYKGQRVLYHSRPGEGRAGKFTEIADVINVEDDDHVELLVILGPNDFHARLNVPRRTDQNPFNSWSFTEYDQEHYRPGDEKAEAPSPTGPLNWDDVKAMHSELGALRNRVAAIEAGQPAKR
jgi:hypothetical protein